MAESVILIHQIRRTSEIIRGSTMNNHKFYSLLDDKNLPPKTTQFLSMAPQKRITRSTEEMALEFSSLYNKTKRNETFLSIDLKT